MAAVIEGGRIAAPISPLQFAPHRLETAARRVAVGGLISVPASHPPGSGPEILLPVPAHGPYIHAAFARIWNGRGPACDGASNASAYSL